VFLSKNCKIFHTFEMGSVHISNEASRTIQEKNPLYSYIQFLCIQCIKFFSIATNKKIFV